MMDRTFLMVLMVWLFSIVSLFAQTNDTLGLEFVDLYYADKNREKISVPNIGAPHSFLVVVSKYGYGEYVTVSLNEGDEPLFYKRKYIAPLDSFAFVLKGDVHCEKVVFFNPLNPKHIRRRNKQLDN